MNRSVYLIVGQVVSACLLSFYGCSSNTAHTLNASEVKTLFSGKTASAYHEIQKAPVSLYYDNNGQVRGIFASGKKGKFRKHLIKESGKQVPVFLLEAFAEGNVHRY